MKYDKFKICKSPQQLQDEIKQLQNQQSELNKQQFLDLNMVSRVANQNMYEVEEYNKHQEAINQNSQNVLKQQIQFFNNKPKQPYTWQDMQKQQLQYEQEVCLTRMNQNDEITQKTMVIDQNLQELKEYQYEQINEEIVDLMISKHIQHDEFTFNHLEYSQKRLEIQQPSNQLLFEENAQILL
ncbi:Hypothetical_protein [Hexamita inflata]|uniref:Hypothetical_protein n=1 Tax=Hexamita inflata TaxID=28002 RepID=A0AA86NYZ3_9EUKA|nr:Hypothetical protein HINF_LOCUS16273 [Hexamita inflata]